MALEAVGDLDHRSRVEEVAGADGHRGRPHEQELGRVLAGEDAAGADDRDPGEGLGDLPDAADGHRPDGRAGQPAGDRGQPGPAPVDVHGHAEQGVDEGQPVRPGVHHRPGHGDQVGDVGGELGQDREAGGGLDGRDDLGRGRRVGGEHLAAVLDVGTGQVDLDQGDPRLAVEAGGQAAELVRAAADQAGDHGGAGVGQEAEVAGAERLHPRVLEADGVEHPRGGLGHARGRAATAGLQADRLGDDPAEGGQVDPAGHLPPEPEAAGGGQHRGTEPDPAQVDGQGGHPTASRSG